MICIDLKWSYYSIKQIISFINCDLFIKNNDICFTNFYIHIYIYLFFSALPSCAKRAAPTYATHLYC